NLRPPFTTLATRLMETTFSTSSISFGSICTNPSLLVLEVQTGFSGPVRQSGHPAVINVTAAIEYHRFDTLRQGLLPDQQSHSFCRFLVALAGQLIPQGRFQGGRRHQSGAPYVINDLGVNMLSAPVHAEPGTFGCTRDLFPNPVMPLLAHGILVNWLKQILSLPSPSACRVTYFLAPALPTFR